MPVVEADAATRKHQAELAWCFATILCITDTGEAG